MSSIYNEKTALVHRSSAEFPWTILWWTVGFSMNLRQSRPGRLPERSIFISILEHASIALSELYILWKNGDGSRFLDGVPLDNTLVTGRLFTELSTVETRTTTRVQYILYHVWASVCSASWELFIVQKPCWFTHKTGEIWLVRNGEILYSNVRNLGG
jgi:hypothetical protein